MGEIKSKVKDIAAIDALHEAINQADLGRAHQILAVLHPGEIATAIESVPSDMRASVWQLIGAEREGDVLLHLQNAVRAEFLEEMRPEQVLDATRGLAADDAADILQNFPGEFIEEILRSMDVQNRTRLSSVLTYPEDTAGGLMDVDVISVRADVSLDVVARYLRLKGEIPENTDSLMVIDRENRCLASLALTELLIRAPQSTVGEWMQEAVCLPANMPKAEVAQLFKQRDLLSAVVIDEDGRLLGRITVDDVVDVIHDEAEHTVRSMAGLGDDDMFSPVITSMRRRAIWLGINLLTAFLGAWVIGQFADTIEQLVALAILMPVVAGMGGVAGSQTLTIAIRGIALGQIVRANIRPLLEKELSVGVFNGIVWSAVVMIIVLVWFDSLPLGLVISAALIINLVIAALAGALIPIALKRYGVDPAIAGGVILTTVTDIVGFMTFLGLAALLLVA